MADELFLVSNGLFGMLHVFRGGKLLRLATGRSETLLDHAETQYPGVAVSRFAPLRVVCCYCDAVVRDAKGQTSHGICDPPCSEALAALRPISSHEEHKGHEGRVAA